MADCTRPAAIDCSRIWLASRSRRTASLNSPQASRPPSAAAATSTHGAVTTPSAMASTSSGGMIARRSSTSARLRSTSAYSAWSRPSRRVFATMSRSCRTQGTSTAARRTSMSIGVADPGPMLGPPTRLLRVGEAVGGERRRSRTRDQRRGLRRRGSPRFGTVRRVCPARNPSASTPVSASASLISSTAPKTTWLSASIACGVSGDGGMLVPLTGQADGKPRRNSGDSVLAESEPSRYAANARTMPRPTTDRTSSARYSEATTPWASARSGTDGSRVSQHATSHR